MTPKKDKMDTINNDIESIKNNMVANLLDLSYITSEYIALCEGNAIEADTDPEKAVEKNGNIISRSQWQDFGNNPVFKDGTYYWKQGDPGSVQSYSCGNKYTKSRYHCNCEVSGKCPGTNMIYYRF